MKRSIKVVICTLLMLLAASMSAAAADYAAEDAKNNGGLGDGMVVLEFASGEINRGEEKEYTIDIPFEAILSINSYYDEDTHGEYNVMLPDLDIDEYFSGDSASDFSYYVSTSAVKPGKYTIKVKTDQFDETTTYCFTVRAFPTTEMLAKSIWYPNKKETLAVGAKTQLLCTLEPYYATDELKWSSSKESVASIRDGFLIGKKIGTSKITVKSKQSGIQKSFSLVVNEMDINMWTSEKKLNLQKFVKGIPGYKNGKWSSSNKAVVKVSSNGKLTPMKSGKAVIKVVIKGQTYKFNIYSYKKSVLQKKAKDALTILTYFPDYLRVDKTIYSIAKDRSAVLVGLKYTVQDGNKYPTQGSFAYVAEDKTYSYGFV